jgi:glucosamine-6-phosphate deaminase
VLTASLAPGFAPLVLAGANEVAQTAAELIANRLRARPRLRMLLPTGHTPLEVYAALRAHAAHGALPSDAATVFQLDEYRGVSPQDERSFAAYLRRELHGIELAVFHGLDGAASDPAAECARHQRLLDEAPIDLAVLGLGHDGHIAFDKPGSSLESGTRVVALHPRTRADAAADFGGSERVPLHALTVGVRTLLAARELLMLVTGADKAGALGRMLLAPAGSLFPASLLRIHPRLTVICDAAAAPRRRGRQPRLRRARPSRPRLQPRAPDLPRIARQGAAGRVGSPAEANPGRGAHGIHVDGWPLRGRADAGGLAASRRSLGARGRRAQHRRQCGMLPADRPRARRHPRCHRGHIGVARSRAVHVRALA